MAKARILSRGDVFWPKVSNQFAPLRYNPGSLTSKLAQAPLNLLAPSFDQCEIYSCFRVIQTLSNLRDVHHFARLHFGVTPNHIGEIFVSRKIDS